MLDSSKISVLLVAGMLLAACNRRLGDPEAADQGATDAGDADVGPGGEESDTAARTDDGGGSNDGLQDEAEFDGSAEEDVGDLPAAPRCAPPDTTDETRIHRHSGVIAGDRFWSCEYVHVLDYPPVVVREGTLAIEPGTTVRSNRSDLFIDTTGRLEAVGNEDEPIVFTSDLLASDPAGLVPGAWGGVTMLGNAPANCGSACKGPARDEDNPVDFGGTDVLHDCGRLEYVRVEFAGKAIDDYVQPALGLFGCGVDTRVDSVEVYRSGGDGLVLAGGDVMLSHIIVNTASRHGVVLRSGYQGVVQFHAGLLDDDAEGSNVEIEPGPDVQTSRATSAQLANLTLIGEGASGSGGLSTIGDVTFGLYNSITLHPALGDFLRFEDETSCLPYLGAGSASKTECVLAQGGLGTPNSPMCQDFAVMAAFDSNLSNDREQSQSSLALDASAVPPELQPATSSEAGGAACALDASFDPRGEQFFGAVDPLGVDWTQRGWARWD